MQNQRRFQHRIVSGVFAGLDKYAQGWFVLASLYRHNAPDTKVYGIQGHAKARQGRSIVYAKKTALVA